MPNPYFQFKQFRVDQDHCAMKVCTDACIQGAFTGGWLTRGAGRVPKSVLDIGTGTGLLSLMLAQRLPDARFDAVELDDGAADQAVLNFRRSPWAGRFSVIHQDIRTFRPGRRYDFIISNPPFYEHDLKSGDSAKDRAMHASDLSHIALLEAIDHLLDEHGQMSVLLPDAKFDGWCAQASRFGLWPISVLRLRQVVRKSYFRVIGIFGREAVPVDDREMAIREASGRYTFDMRQLLEDFYLYFPGEDPGGIGGMQA